jgi:hypothetical protein
MSRPMIHTVRERQEESMAWKTTRERARKDLEEGKRPSTAAGEFVHEEMEHVRRGKHGARSAKQAIAIGLSKARRAGVPLAPPREGRASTKTVRSAELAYDAGQGRRKTRKSPARSRATSQALKRESRTAASHDALSKQARGAAARRRREGVATTSAQPQAAAADRPRRRRSTRSSSSSATGKASSSRARKRGSRKR